MKKEKARAFPLDASDPFREIRHKVIWKCIKTPVLP